jgi:hypothetical protein
MNRENWAEIRANGTVVRYRRGGVVVICPRLGIVVPELSDPSALGPFIEGLGGRGLTILAASPFYEAALELAESDPERIERVSPFGG